MKLIYLDYAATTPTDPRVVEAMTPYFTDIFGNASSPHQFGQKARGAMENARAQLAKVVGAKPSEIVFTSGATEANNHAILGTAKALAHKGRHIVASIIEHHSVHEPLEQLVKMGFEVTLVNVDSEGFIKFDDLYDAIQDDTIMMCCIHGNNEIGTIQPVGTISKLVRSKGIVFLVDAVQTVGHIPVDVNVIGCDLLSLSAHKFYGPKGVGALYIREGFKINKLLWGGDQERERRASTQNVPGIVGMGKAIELCSQQMAQETQEQIRLRDHIIKVILSGISGSKLNGSSSDRLPNNINVTFDGIVSEELLTALDMDGVAASMGSACTSGVLEPSHVLRAIGRNKKEAFGSLRITIGRWTTQEDVDQFLAILKTKVESLRQ